MTRAGFFRKTAALIMAFVMTLGVALGFTAQDTRAMAAPNIVATPIPTGNSVEIRIDHTLALPVHVFRITLIGPLGTAIPVADLPGAAFPRVFNIAGLSNGTHSFTIHAIDVNQLSIASTSGNFIIGGAAGGVTVSQPTFLGDVGGSPRFSATVSNWTIMQGGTFGFVASRANNTAGGNLIPLSMQPITTNVTNNVFEGIVNTVAGGLTSGGTYWAFAYFTDVNGTTVYSPSGVQFTHAMGRPVLTTTSVTFNNHTGLFNAQGNISSIGTSSITEFGFVFSNVNQAPTINDFRVPITTHSVFGPSNITLDFPPQFVQNTTSTTFWVRAYAMNAAGVSYGEVRQVTGVNVPTGSVSMTAVNVTGATTAQTNITVAGITAANIFEWGVVAHTSGVNLDRNTPGALVFFATNNDTLTNTVQMTGLQSNTLYYVRAFARARNSATYVLSPITQFTTLVNIDATVSRPVAITHNSATLSGNINTHGNTITEQGFVFSRVNQTPDINNATVARHQSTAGGSFHLEVTNLQPSTRYFVRSFARFGPGPNDIVYSDVEQFTTAANTAVLTVSFRDQSGIEFGTQTIPTSIGSIITERSLVPPVGTRLEQERFHHNVQGNETVIVRVIPAGGQQPPAATPPPSGGWTPPPQHTGEEPYMMGIGQYMFGPSNYGTFIEVAAMLFTLLADPHTTYHSPFWFPDVDYSNPLTANIVNFVSSRGYMIGNDLGLFQTNQPINRASVAVVIGEVLGLADRYGHFFPFPSAFPDTEHHWSRGFVFVAVMAGLFGGSYNEHGILVFRPDDFVTRAELAQVFYNMFDRTGQPLGNRDFVDVPPTHWAYRVIMNAAIPHW